MSRVIKKDLVIIGGGPAGMSAGIYAARALLDAVLLEQEALGGQVIITSEVDNYPGAPHTDGYTLTEAMRSQAVDLGADIAMDVAEAIERQDGQFIVRTSGDIYSTKTIILASGATPRHAGFDGEDDYIGKGVSYCATCDGMFFRSRHVFVIGGGNSAAEEALFLARFASSVTMIVRKDHLRAQAAIVREIEENKTVDIRYLTSIVSVAGGDAVREITFRDNVTGDEYTETFETGAGVFVFVGRTPATELVRDLVELTPTGYIVTDDRMATATPGLFAAGDVRDKPLRQIITAAADGAIAATSVSAYLGHPVEG